MNIFYLDENPVQAAQAHCDKHVVKMILESAQILCTVHHLHGTATLDMYKPTHKNHPCVLWAAESRSHYNWLFQLFSALLDEYSHRYHERVHACSKLYNVLIHPPNTLVSNTWRQPPQAMPEIYHHNDSGIAYRRYYLGEKVAFAQWSHRSEPDWWCVV
jgi:hypothetical protein